MTTMPQYIKEESRALFEITKSVGAIAIPDRNSAVAILQKIARPKSKAIQCEVATRLMHIATYHNNQIPKLSLCQTREFLARVYGFNGVYGAVHTAQLTPGNKSKASYKSMTIENIKQESPALFIQEAILPSGKPSFEVWVVDGNYMQAIVEIENTYNEARSTIQRRLAKQNYYPEIFYILYQTEWGVYEVSGHAGRDGECFKVETFGPNNDRRGIDKNDEPDEDDESVDFISEARAQEYLKNQLAPYDRSRLTRKPVGEIFKIPTRFALGLGDPMVHCYLYGSPVPFGSRLS